MHHQQRGLPHRRYKVWSVLHNFDTRAADETTPAARCFRCAFPDLFETVLAEVGALPQPRQRKRLVCSVLDVRECPALRGDPGFLYSDTQMSDHHVQSYLAAYA